MINTGEEIDTEFDIILLDKNTNAEKTETVHSESGKIEITVSNNTVVYLRKNLK